MDQSTASPAVVTLSDAFLAAIAAAPTDRRPRLIYADYLAEQGDDAGAEAQRRRAADIPLAGQRCVTVARQGSNMAATGGGHSVPVYCTAIYTAARRADGLLTWRRTGSVGYGTSGRAISGPMIARAQAEANRLGLPYLPGVRHGTPATTLGGEGE